MKIWILVDVKTYYIKNFQVYLGKQGNVPEKNQGQRVVLDLVSILSPGKKYKLTTDNFFTTVSLSNELLKMDITLLGTMNPIRKEIPSILLANKTRSLHSSTYLFTRKQTLVSHVPKKNRAVILLSTRHHVEENDKTSPHKPKMIEITITENSESILSTRCFQGPIVNKLHEDGHFEFS